MLQDVKNIFCFVLCVSFLALQPLINLQFFYIDCKYRLWLSRVTKQERQSLIYILITTYPQSQCLLMGWKFESFKFTMNYHGFSDFKMAAGCQQ